MAAAGAVILSDPWHPAAERYRALALTLLAAEPTPRSLVVTSGGADEGRATVAANLAVALAEQGVRVALVDADLKEGGLALFRAPGQPGWPSVALGEAVLEDVVHEVALGESKSTLHFLPAGVLAAHPLEILASGKVRNFFAGLEERYDLVVLNTRSLADGHDAAVLGGRSDGVLLVARSGRTKKEALQEAAEQLRRGRAELLGIVLDEIEPRRG